ncbi:MAG: hypothetical protein ACJ764_10425 [Solirubrobacteraceae bacterium]
MSRTRRTGTRAARTAIVVCAAVATMAGPVAGAAVAKGPTTKSSGGGSITGHKVH